MAAVASLVTRVRGVIAATLRGAAEDKGEKAPPSERPVTHLRPPRPHGAKRSTPRQARPAHPRPRHEGSIRSVREGVALHEYLPPSPHTVGVPVLDHPPTPRRHAHALHHAAHVRHNPTVVYPAEVTVPPGAGLDEAARHQRRRASQGEVLQVQQPQSRRGSLDSRVPAGPHPPDEACRDRYVTGGRDARPGHSPRFVPASRVRARRRSASPPPARRHQPEEQRRPGNGKVAAAAAAAARSDSVPDGAASRSRVWTIQIHPPTPSPTTGPTPTQSPTPGTGPSPDSSTPAAPGRMHAAGLALRQWHQQLKQGAATRWDAAAQQAPTLEEVVEALGQAQVTPPSPPQTCPTCAPPPPV